MLSAAQAQAVTSCQITIRSFHPFCRCKPAPESPCDSLAHINLLTAPGEEAPPCQHPKNHFHSFPDIISAHPIGTPTRPLCIPQFPAQPPTAASSAHCPFFHTTWYFGFQKARAPIPIAFDVGPASTPQAQHKVSSDIPDHSCVLAG